MRCRTVEYTVTTARRVYNNPPSSLIALKIVTRYILREHIGPLVFALSALTSLLLLNFIAIRIVLRK